MHTTCGARPEVSANRGARASPRGCYSSERGFDAVGFESSWSVDAHGHAVWMILTLCIHPAGRQEREDLCTQEALLSPVQVTRTAHTRAKVVYADHPAEVKCAGRRARSAWVQCLFQQRNSWPFRPYRRHQSLRLLAGHVPCAHCARITSPSPANRAESVCFIYCCYQVGSQRRTANHAQMGQRRLLCNCAAAPRVEIGAASMPRAKTQHPPHLRH